MSIRKSKARKLAEFLRNITAEAKLTTEAVQDDKVVTTGSDLDSKSTDTTALVSAASVTSYVGDKLDDYVHSTHDINLTFTGDVTGHGTITDMSHTSFNLTLDAETLPNQSGYAGKFLTTDGTTASWATVDTSNGDTAYSWGDHAQAGYLTSETNDYVDSVSFSTSSGILRLGRTGSLSDLTVDLDGRYLQSFTETDTLQSVTARGNTTNSNIYIQGGNSLIFDSQGQNLGGDVALRANGEAFEIYEKEDANKLWLRIEDDPAGNNSALKVNSTIGMATVWHAGNFNPNSYLRTSDYEDTTYNVSAVDVSGGKAVRLTGSDGTTDDVKFAAGSNVSLARSGDTITISSTDTNTDTNTTDWYVANSSGGNQFKVDKNENVRFEGTGATSVSFNASNNKITISSTDTNTETTTNLVDNGDNTITYTNEEGTAQTIDLSLYLDDTNLARILSGTMNSSGIATFTRDDDTTFTVDMSVLLDDTNLSRITSASWNTSNGVLTLTRNDNTTVAVDLDGRYVQKNADIVVANAGPKITLTDTTDSDDHRIAFSNSSTELHSINTIGSRLNIDSVQDIKVNRNGTKILDIVSSGLNVTGAVNATSFSGSLNYNDITNPPVIDNSVDYINGASFNTSNGILTLSGVGRAGATVDLDGRYYSTTDSNNRYVLKTGDTMTGNLKVSIPDTGSAPAMTCELKLWGYEGRGAGISIRDQANSASGSSNREWFIGTGYSQSGFNIGYSSTGSQTSYTAQNKLSIDTSGNAIFAGTVKAPSVYTDNVYDRADTSTRLEMAGDGGGVYTHTANGYIQVGALNSSFAHIYTDRPSFYFNKQLRVLGHQVFHNAYHPNADKWTTARTNTVTLTGDVTGTGSASVDGTGNWTVSIPSAVVNDSHSHSNYMLRSSSAQGGINNQLESSAYRFEPSADNPTNEHYAVLTYGNQGNVVGQLATHFVNGATYNRAHNNSWSAWSRMYDDDYHPISWNEITDKPSIDNSVDYINSASFNTSTGVLTLSGVGRAGATIDLDGRYLRSETDSQTLSWNGSNGQLSISNGNTVDLDGRYTLNSQLGLIGNSDVQPGSTAGWPNNPTGGTYITDYVGHGGTVIMSADAPGSTGSLAIEATYNGHIFYHSNTDSNRWTSHQLFTDAYHPNADKWTTARRHTVTLTGDVTGSAYQDVDGTGNKTWSINTVVANNSHTHDDRYVRKTGDTMTGPLVINGNASYVGSSGYNTLVLQDVSNYPGINFSHSNGNIDWLYRMNGADSSIQWFFRNGGNHTERMSLTSGGRLTLKGGTQQETLIVEGDYPQITIRKGSVPDASIHYDSGYAKKWNVGPGAGHAEEAEFGFAVYSGPRGTLYTTPLRINADTGYVQVGDRDNPTERLDVDGNALIRGNLTVQGNISQSDGFGTLYTFNTTQALSTSWANVSAISGSTLPTGTYAIQIKVYNSDAGGGNYDEHYSGTMAWYGTGTNDNDSNEIPLHNAGHAYNGAAIYARTLRRYASAEGNMILQLAASGSISSDAIEIKIRRLI